MASAPVRAYQNSAPVSGQRRSIWARLWPESSAVSPIPALDGLRAIAVLLVVLFHAWYKLPGYLAPGEPEIDNPLDAGHTGVHLFFVLSGFLLFLPYARWLFQLQGRPSALLFYKRRALRVGPAYWVSLGLIGLAGPYILSRLKDVLFHALFLSNLSNETAYSLNGVYYTMAVEVQFYVTLPLIGWACYRLARKLGTAPGVIAVLAGMVTIALVDKAVSDSGSFATVPVVSTLLLSLTALPYWLSVFAAGIGASILYTYFTLVWPGKTDRARRLVQTGSLVFLLGSGLWLALVFVPVVSQIPAPLFGVAYALILLGILFGAPIIRAPFESRPLRFVGLVSYSLYIWHLGAFKIVEPLLRRLPLVEHVVARFVIGGAVGVAVAYISYQLTERPFMNARKKAHEALRGASAVMTTPAGSIRASSALSNGQGRPSPHQSGRLPEEDATTSLRALNLARVIKDRVGEGAALNSLGRLARAQGRKDEAERYYREAFAIAREVGDLSGMGATLNNLGRLAHSLGKKDEAARCYQQALEFFEELGDSQAIAIVRRHVAELGKGFVIDTAH